MAHWSSGWLSQSECCCLSSMGVVLFPRHIPLTRVGSTSGFHKRADTLWEGYLYIVVSKEQWDLLARTSYSISRGTLFLWFSSIPQPLHFVM